MAVIYIALLRAINVGGRAVVRMVDLREAFVRAGCVNVRTYIQSGNVVFEAGRARPAALFDRIRAEVGELLGTEPAICFRTLEEIEGVIAADPFGPLAGDRLLKLYVAFLDRTPEAMPPLPLTVAKEACDVVGCRDSEVFVVSHRKPNGMYGFPNAIVEQLGVTSTTRNWTTVTKLAAFARRG